MTRLKIEVEELSFKLGLAYNESNLYLTKWFDYRLLQPFLSTDLFYNYYQSVSKDFINESGTGTKQLKEYFDSKLEDSKFYRYLTLARANFDAIGCRYDFGIRFGFRRAHKDGWADLIPASYLADDIFLLDLKDAWDEECANTLQIPANILFQIENYSGRLDQINYIEWLKEQIKKRNQPEGSIATAIVKGVLSHEDAKNTFGQDRYQKAMWWADNLD